METQKKSKKVWIGGLIITIIAVLTMYGIYSMNKSNWDSMSEDYVLSIEAQGYSNVKYVEYSFWGPGTTVNSTPPTFGGIGYGLYEGVRNNNGKAYKIWIKPLGESESLIVKTKLKYK